MMAHLYDLALVLGLFVAASGCGLWLLEGMRLRAPGRVQHVLFASGLGLGLLGYVTFALGMAALLRRPLIAAAYVLALVLGLWGWRRFWRARPLARGKLRAWSGHLSWPARMLLGFLSLVTGINLLAALAPVIGVDELIYRLAAADLYLRHGRLFYIPSMRHHQQPQQVQMIQLWGMSLGSHSTAQVVQWAMGLLLMLALIDLGRREMPLAWAMLGGAIFYSYSDVIVLSGRASPDLANGFFMGLSVLAWLHWLQTGDRRWLTPAAILAGLFAAGARLPGAYGAIALTVLVFVFGWRRFHWSPLSALVRAFAVGFLAFLVVMPWYVKSYLQTGSPTWPLLMNIFGARDWTPAAYEYVMGIQTSRGGVGPWLSPQRILAAPWDLTMNPDLFNSGVIGPLVLATLPFALVIRLPSRLRWVLAACGVLAPLWYVSYPRLRAFIPGVALLSVVVGYLLWQLWKTELLLCWARRIVIGFVGLWLILGLGVTVRFHLRAGLITLGAQEESVYLSQRLIESDMRFYWYDDYQALNRMLPVGSHLLIYDSRGYYLKHDYDHYDLIAKREIQPERLRDPDYVAEKVHQLGSDYILLWPKPRHATAYELSNWLEDTLYELCHSRWPIVYRSDTMIVCQVQPFFTNSTP